MPARPAFAVVVTFLIVTVVGCQAPPPAPTTTSPYAPWVNGPPTDPSFFPIMVWTQDPELAPRYKAIGVNTYLGLWNGPTERHLATLDQHGMYVICAQNDVAGAHLDDRTIIGWMHADEPDNIHAAYDGPVPFEKVAADTARMITADPTRPVLINFGQGVANERFGGRALPYDRYPLYCRAADIVSFDVYPVANLKVSTAGADGEPRTMIRDDGRAYLWYVAKGVDRLGEWSGPGKIVWNILECTAISHPKGHKATGREIRAEAWMSLIHGSRGLCWFVHDFRPGHRSASALLDDPEMTDAVAAVNREILALAPVLNSPTVHGSVVVATDSESAPVDVMVKRHDGATYLFAASMRDEPTRASFALDAVAGAASVEVLGEDRTLIAADGAFDDHFDGYDVHLYKIAAE